MNPLFYHHCYIWWVIHHVFFLLSSTFICLNFCYFLFLCLFMNNFFNWQYYVRLNQDYFSIDLHLLNWLIPNSSSIHHHNNMNMLLSHFLFLLGPGEQWQWYNFMFLSSPFRLQRQRDSTWYNCYWPSVSTPCLSKDRCLDCCIQFCITICLTNNCFELFCFSSSTLRDYNRLLLRWLFPFQSIEY